MIQKTQDWGSHFTRGAYDSGATMLERVRASLQARLEGRNEGGDTEVMRLVDEIVKKESTNVTVSLADKDFWSTVFLSLLLKGDPVYSATKEATYAVEERNRLFPLKSEK